MQFLWLELVRLPDRILGIIIKVCICLEGEIVKIRCFICAFKKSRFLSLKNGYLVY